MVQCWYDQIIQKSATRKTGSTLRDDLLRKTSIYLLPFVLLLTTAATFYFFSEWFGKRPGYFFAFVFYWLVWCLTIPLLMIGPGGVVELYKIRKPALGKKKLRNIAFLVFPLVLVYCYEFPKVIGNANQIVIVSSAMLAVVNGTLEEILWRGTFLKIIGENSKWYVLFSSLGFAIWHFAPQIVFRNPNPGGAFSFVGVSFALGLLYSMVVKDTRSIFLTTISHILFDFSGLGGRLYF